MRASLYPDTRLSELPEGIVGIHIVRPVGKKKIASLLKRFPSIEKITTSFSCYNRTGLQAKKFLKEKGIPLKVVTERGRAISIPLGKMRNAIEMRRDFRPFREIETITGIPKSTVHYLVKYSRKRKVKEGSNVIYLK